MKHPLFLSSFALALLLTPALSVAQPPDTPPNRSNPRRQGEGQFRPGGPDGSPMYRNPMQRREAAKAELGLTDAQQADLRKVMEGARRDRLRKTTDWKIARMDLKSLLRTEKVDEKAVALKVAEAQAAQGALLKLRVDTALAMKRILTPEQQKKMNAMRAGRGANRMRGRQGSGRGRMGPPMGRGMRGDESDLDPDPDPDDEDVEVIR